jgi:hypothetical protein
MVARLFCELSVDGQASFLVGYRRGAKNRWIERGAYGSSASGYSIIVGILVALLISAGAFILLVSQQ